MNIYKYILFEINIYILLINMYIVFFLPLWLVQALAFLERYARLRREQEVVEEGEEGEGEEEGNSGGGNFEGLRWCYHQEVLYNMGRAYHQMQINHLATHYYT